MLVSVGSSLWNVVVSSSHADGGFRLLWWGFSGGLRNPDSPRTSIVAAPAKFVGERHGKGCESDVRL